MNTRIFVFFYFTLLCFAYAEPIPNWQLTMGSFTQRAKAVVKAELIDIEEHETKRGFVLTWEVHEIVAGALKPSETNGEKIQTYSGRLRGLGVKMNKNYMVYLLPNYDIQNVDTLYTLWFDFNFSDYDFEYDLFIHDKFGHTIIEIDDFDDDDIKELSNVIRMYWEHFHGEERNRIKYISFLEELADHHLSIVSEHAKVHLERFGRSRGEQ